MTPATIFRLIDLRQPTILFDEYVFGAKALAGIGELPDTIKDRCITIEMRRQARHESAEKFRREQRRKAEPIAERLADSMQSSIGDLANARPPVPDALDDRAADGWEPLFAIADLAGTPWPAAARAASVALSGDTGSEATSIGQRLLSDIRTALGTANLPTIETESGLAVWSYVLVAEMNSFEESEWFETKLVQPQMARILRPFGIRSASIRQGTTVRRGYRVAEFDDAFMRYLPAVHDTATGTTAATSPDGRDPPRQRL